MTEYDFFVTVRKRDDLKEPTNVERAEALVKWLLQNGNHLEFIKIQRVEKD